MKKFVLFILLIGIGAASWMWLETRPVDVSAKKSVLLKIQSGQSVAQIAALLSDDHLIRSPLAFKIYARFSGTAGKLKAGAFLLNTSLSVSEILSVLETGKSEQISVTIPEGYTVGEIDALLAAKGLGESGAIIDCAFHCDFSSFDFLPSVAAGSRDLGFGSRLEGYLFPETYFVDIADYQPKFFLERMLGTFRKRIADPYADDVKKSGKSLGDIVIMASLLEQESRGESERPIVAGMLWKRLAAKTVLGVDATIRYALRKSTEALTKDDLETDSAYNTRHRKGLPPSPIANAGLSAFLAALHPEVSQYWYYLHGGDGVIHYAVTNDEHNRNRARYLR